MSSGSIMHNSNSYIAISFLLCLLFFSVPDAFAQKRNPISVAERISGDTFPYKSRTPKGARVYAAIRPSRGVMSAIDRGLSGLFAVARKNGYTRRLKYSDYTIFIAKPDREKNSAGRYSPDIAVGAAQYAGSAYDKGGYIYAAGIVVSNDPLAFLIADHSKDLRRVSNVVRFEGEHLVLYHNDRRRYAQTADHSKGGSHPILQ